MCIPTVYSFFFYSANAAAKRGTIECMELNDSAKKNCGSLTYIRYTDRTKHATAAKYIRSSCHTYLHI